MAEKFQKRHGRIKISSNSVIANKYNKDQDRSAVDVCNMESQPKFTGMATALQSTERKRMEMAITEVAERSVKRLSDSVAAQMAEKHLIFEKFYNQGVELLKGYKQYSVDVKKEIDELQGVTELESEHEKTRLALAKEIEGDVKQLQKILLEQEHEKDLASMQQSIKEFMLN